MQSVRASAIITKTTSNLQNNCQFSELTHPPPIQKFASPSSSTVSILQNINDSCACATKDGTNRQPDCVSFTLAQRAEHVSSLCSYTCSFTTLVQTQELLPGLTDFKNPQRVDCHEKGIGKSPVSFNARQCCLPLISKISCGDLCDATWCNTSTLPKGTLLCCYALIIANKQFQYAALLYQSSIAMKTPIGMKNMLW